MTGFLERGILIDGGDMWMTKTRQSKIDANTRYNQRQDAIMLRPSREIGSRIRKAASDAGVPLQRYIVQIVMDRIEADERKMQ